LLSPLTPSASASTSFVKTEGSAGDALAHRLADHHRGAHLSESWISVVALVRAEQAEVALADVCRSVVAEAAIVHPNRQIVLDAKDDPVGEWDASGWPGAPQSDRERAATRQSRHAVESR